MNTGNHFLLLAWLLLTGSTSTALAIYIWTRRASRGAKRFGWVSMVGGIWALFLMAEILTPHLSGKIIWNDLQTIGGFVPPLFLFFVLDYTDRSGWLKPGLITAFLTPPLLTVISAFLDFPPGWTRAAPYIEEGAGLLPLVSFTYGPWSIVAMIFSALVMVASLALLFDRLLYGAKIYRLQVTSLILGILLPTALNLALSSRFPEIPFLSLLPLTFPISTLISGWALLRYRLFDLAPIARAALLERMADPVLVLDNQLRIIDLNQPAQSLLGTDLERAFGQSFDHTLPLGLAGLLNFARSDEERVELALGSPPLTYEVTRSPLSRNRGQLLVMHDISAQKALQRALQTSEERYRLLVENGNDGIGLVQDQRFRFVNPQLAEIIGYTSQEIEGQLFQDFIAPERREEILEFHQKRLRGESVPFQYMLEVVHKSGQRLTLDLSARVMYIEGQPAVLFFARDVTEQVKTASLLEESREQYRDLYHRAQQDAAEHKRLYALQSATLEAATDGFLVVGLDGSVITYNSQFVSLWNLPANWLQYPSRTERLELLARQVQNREEYIARVQELFGNPEMESLDLIELADGRIFERRTVPYRMDNEIVGRLWNFRDISERKRAEQTEQAYRDLLEARTKETEILKRVAETLNQVLPPARALEVSLKIVAEQIQATAGWFLILEPTGEATLSASYRLPPSLAKLKEENCPWGICRCLERMLGGDLKSSDAEILGCQRLEESGELPANLQHHVSIPVQASGRPVGMLNLVVPAERKFDSTEMRLLEAFGDQFGGAVERARLFEHIQRLAITDGLTGLFNRRHFFVKAQEEYERALRYNHPLSILMIDVDHFKHVNDEHGHHAGDLVLKQVAETCRKALRQVDIIGRYGGEELVVLMPETAQDSALQAAERLRESIISLQFPNIEKSLCVTISIGVATLEDTIELDRLLDRADQALYQAKDFGRNQVKIWTEGVETSASG